MSKLMTFPPITQMMDEGVQKEIDLEFEKWNKRDKIERFPLSPSQIGKCGLLLARNLAHFLGIRDYPRAVGSRPPRVQRIFKRGDLLEDALIADIEKYTVLKVKEQQKEVTLFTVQSNASRHAIRGAVDGIVVHEQQGVRILTDFKSKGAFYSSGFSDSIAEMFQEMKQTGLVVEITPTCFAITDAKALFDVTSMDDFFVDYLLQLNSYAFSDEIKKMGGVDFVSLYYENKNTCANYELRWEPRKELFDFAHDKFQYIYDTVLREGPEQVDKEFALGSAKCRLCEYNVMCWGEYVPKGKADRMVGSLKEPLDTDLRRVFMDERRSAKVMEIVLLEMEKNNLTHITLSDGMTYERKFLKSPKPHYELRMSK